MDKIIHCIWLGGPKTKLALKCRASWECFAPDWNIREWGLERRCEGFRLKVDGDDAGSIAPPKYVQDALAAKKWAFVSDWMRFVVLEREGGVYFDYDVELVRPFGAGMEELGLANCEWCAREYLTFGGEGYAPGAGLALEKGSEVARQMLKAYEGSSFDGKTTIGDLMAINGIELKGVKPEVFCPFDCNHRSLWNAETLGVHHYVLSWISPRRRVAKWLNEHGLRGVVNALLKVKWRLER